MFSGEAVPMLVSPDALVCTNDSLVNAADGVDTVATVFVIAARV
jgi:hypothetical protein